MRLGLDSVSRHWSVSKSSTGFFGQPPDCASNVVDWFSPESSSELRLKWNHSHAKWQSGKHHHVSTKSSRIHAWIRVEAGTGKTWNDEMIGLNQNLSYIVAVRFTRTHTRTCHEADRRWRLGSNFGLEPIGCSRNHLSWFPCHQYFWRNAWLTKYIFALGRCVWWGIRVARAITSLLVDHTKHHAESQDKSLKAPFLYTVFPSPLRSFRLPENLPA